MFIIIKRMNCEYCNSEFKTKSALNNHKNKAKYCLILQGKIEPKEEEVNLDANNCVFHFHKTLSSQLKQFLNLRTQIIHFNKLKSFSRVFFMQLYQI